MREWTSVVCTKSHRGSEKYSVMLPDGTAMGEQPFIDAAKASGLLNTAYAAGRASREGLREALVRIGYAASGRDKEFIEKALAEDDGEDG